MDAPEEDLDVKLHKISGDLISDFDRSLKVLLRKQDGSLRSRVRMREANRLVYNVSSLLIALFSSFIAEMVRPSIV